MEVRTSCIAFICKSLFLRKSMNKIITKVIYKIACQVLIL